MIAAIPKEDQVPILETDVQHWIYAAYKGYKTSDEVSTELNNRLHAGAAKYGTAWNEVDLTEDLREEILDAMNYVVMLLVRRNIVNEGKGNADDVALGAIAEYLMGTYNMVATLDHCEGPTSKDWASKDPDAQQRFQDTLRRQKEAEDG